MFSSEIQRLNSFGSRQERIEVPTDSDETADFVSDGRHGFYLEDAAGQRALTISDSGSGFMVKQINSTNTSKHFWVIYSPSPHGTALGLWLVGQGKDGTFVKFKSPQDFPNHQEMHLYEIVPKDDKLLLTAQMEYLPDGKYYGYERQYVTDYQAELAWDYTADTFTERNLLQE